MLMMLTLTLSWTKYPTRSCPSINILDVDVDTCCRDGHQNLKLLLIDLNQMHLIGLVERNILVFKSSKSDVPLQSYGF